MTYSVKLTETAKQDILEISLYIAELTKDRATAKRYANGLRDKCNGLRSFPNAGALPRDEFLRSVGFRYVIYKDKYLIFYKVDDAEKTVTVYAVFNAKADYTRIMRDLI